MVSSRYSLIAFDSNSDTASSTRRTGTFLCGEMARNQSGRLSGSMWRNSNGAFFSRSTIAARCTHGHVLKLTSRYFAIVLFFAPFTRLGENVTSGARGPGAPMTDQAADPAIIRNYHVH